MPLLLCPICQFGKQGVRARIRCEGVTSEWGELSSSPSLDTAGGACSPSPGCDTPSRPHLGLPIFHVTHLVLGSPSSASPGKASLIYFRLGLHALRKDSHRDDSSFASFFCVICSGFITQARQPILAFLGLWECPHEGSRALLSVSAQDTCLPLPRAAHPDPPFPSIRAQAESLLPPG